MISCSTTSGLPEGEKLYIGLKEISYGNHESTEHYLNTREEIDAALQTAPNGALFGSSFYRTPFPYGLWIWNAFHETNGKFGKWLLGAFGKKPVLMNNVNPVLRAKVASNILKNNGYFNGNVSYEIIETKNPKKEKISYRVEPGEVYRIDTLTYANFPEDAVRIISRDSASALIKHGTPFTTENLDAERNRITKLLRDEGYYFYHASYASYLADTLKKKNWAELCLQMADSIPEDAQRQWFIGKRTIDIKRTYLEELTDSTERSSLKVRFNGKKPPVRTGVILSNMRDIRRGKLYSAQANTDAVNKLASQGLFSNVNFQFIPRGNDSLDVNVLCVLEKPYDFYIQSNFKHKMTERTGPELKIGITKKNAFRGGEKFDINLHASYEWQDGDNLTTTADRNSYEVGMDASLEWPRLLIPFINGKRTAQGFQRRRLRFAITPATKITGSFNIINRPNFYRMHSASGEWSYIWKPQENITHQLSPLILTYQKLNYRSEKFDSILNHNPYLKVAMQDMLIPKLQYSYTYISPKSFQNPIVWSATFTEAGNLTSMINKAFFGQAWTETNKTMFKNIYSQFLKLETNFRKTWRMDSESQMVFHTNAGVAWSYGNLNQTPFTEQFFIGGANSVRAFAARSLGPGSYKSHDRSTSYVDQTGDILLLLNMEYRRRLFGNLYGAAFIDAGNVWAMREDGREGAQFKLKNILKETAIGTGFGIRYDLDFLVLRLDWGIGLHAPYKTSRSGIYNFEKFKDSHTLHFAIGYPF